MTRDEKEDIIIIATIFRFGYNTRDPFIIAQKAGIDIDYIDKDKGYSYNGLNSEKKEIKINKKYKNDYNKKKIICAHELGHICLGHIGKKYYKDNDLEREYCANLFAVALLFNRYAFNIDIVEMDNYTLQSILDYNLK